MIKKLPEAKTGNALAVCGQNLARASDGLIENILPLGWIVLLTGMLWLGDRPYYHRAYYLLLATPALLAVLFCPARLRSLFSSPLLIVFTLFILYVTLSIAWSGSDRFTFSLVKKPLYVLLLFFSGGLLALKSPKRLMFAFRAGALIASLIGVVLLGVYVYEGMPERQAVYGILHNPLIGSHVYGYFMAFWLADWFSRQKPTEVLPLFSLLVFGLLIAATGSRTPILAVAASFIWLIATHWNRRSAILLLMATLAGGLLFVLEPERFLARGTSLRPEIWGSAWLQILDAPWFGHGYDAPMAISIPGIDEIFADPHNMPLLIFYDCGVIGLAFWLSLYALALLFAWRHRNEPMVMMASTLVVFGFVASMTEGGSFLSRPKEQWFLTWIPMTLLFAAELMHGACRREKDDLRT
jgi:O-antigen ligase